MQTAGHGQIEDLQLAVLGVLGLIFLVGQGNFFFFHVRTGADEDAVVVAPCRKTEAAMDFQVLDRVEDVGAVLDDLAEQAAQGVAALAQDAGRIEDGPVDASALEDADVLEHGTVRGEQLIGVQNGTTGWQYCTDDFGSEHVAAFDNGITAVQALMNDQVDCVVIDQAPAQSFVEQNPGLTILDTEYAVEDYAIGVAKGNTALVDAVNGALAELTADGTIQSIIEKYIPAEG